MSSGEVRKVSRQDIQLVQNLIERCLQLYMNQKEVVDTLLYQAKIEPGFTELVWQKLEEENQEFFKAYHVRLLLKNQIIVFNKLLEKQVELMQICPPTPPGVASVPHANVQQTQPCYVSDHASSSPIPDNMFCNGMNGASSGNQSIQLGNDVSILAERTNIPSSLLSTHSSYAGRTNGSDGTSLSTTHNSHVGRSNGNNGTTEIKSEPSYSNNSDFSFGADDSFLDTRAPIGVEQSSSFTGSELNGQPLNDSILDIDNSYGFLSQIPRNFSFSDLADDFTRTADILENYGPGRSPFLESETDDFSDSPQRDCKEEDRRLDTISQDVSYDDFASD